MSVIKIKIFDVATGDIVEEQNDAVVKKLKSATVVQQKKLLDYLMTGVNQDKYFTDDADIDNDTMDLFYRFVGGTQKDVDFLIRALVYSRENSVSPQFSILGLVILSTLQDQGFDFDKIFNRIVKNIDDLFVFANIINMKLVRGFGRRVRQSMANKLKELTPYDAIKYSVVQRTRPLSGARSDSLNLGDILKLSHTMPQNDEQNEMFKWIFRKSYDQNKVPELIRLFEKIRVTSENDETTKIVKEHAFPFEVIYPSFSRAEAWRGIYLHSNIETIVDNIKTFKKKHIFTDPDCISYTVSLFTDIKIIRQAKLMPDKLMRVYDILQDESSIILFAVEKAIEMSYINLPEINKDITFMLDSSSGMKSLDRVPVTQSLTYETDGAILASVMGKACTKMKVLTFADKVYDYDVDPARSTIAISNGITQFDVGAGGSIRDYCRPVTHILEEKYKTDVIVMFTGTNSLLNIFRDETNSMTLTNYINTVNPEVKMLFVTNSGDSHNHSLNNLTLVSRWNNNTIKYLFYKLSDDKDIMEQVSSISL